jgi:translation initiation factor IF-2
MADNDDKHGDDAGAGGKKTLTLKGAPNLGSRPGMSRSSRTVVVEKRTRVVRPGTPGSEPAAEHAADTAAVPQSAAEPASLDRADLQ